MSKEQRIIDELLLNCASQVSPSQTYVTPGGTLAVPYESDDCVDFTWIDVDDWVEHMCDEDELSELTDVQFNNVVTALTKEFTNAYREHLTHQLSILNGDFNANL